MGTVSIDSQLPGWAVCTGCVLILLMAAGILVCIARDIAEMRLLWMAGDPGRRKSHEKRENKTVKKQLRRRKNPHGVDLHETDLRAVREETGP